MNPIFNELNSWLSAFVFMLPGKIGQFVRVAWGRIALASFANGARLGPNCVVVGGKNIRLGSNSEASAGCCFIADGGQIQVGDRVKFNHNVHLNASVGGDIKVGDDCLIGPGVVLRSASHNFDDLNIAINQQGHSAADIILANNVWLAANVVVLPGVELGSGCVVAAGSVVTKSFPENSVIAGVPGKRVRSRGAEDG